MRNRTISLALVAVLVSVWALTASAVTTRYWQGVNSDWNDPNNWTGGIVPTGAADQAQVDPVVSGIYPVISEDGECFAIRQHSATTEGETTITMVSGTYTSLSDMKLISRNTATAQDVFYMQGGTLNCPTKLYVGYYSPCKAVFNMTGGTVNVGQLISTGNASNGEGEILLHGGVMTTSSFVFRYHAHMDIADTGVWILDGDQVAAVDAAVADGYLTAYDGAGFIMRDYDTTNTGKTTVWAQLPVAGQAADPAPDTGQAGLEPNDVELSWTAGAMAVSHNVYFGTDQDAVANATDPEADPGQGNQTGTSFLAGDLLLGETYYWRVDEVDGASNVVDGTLWNFSIRSSLMVDDFEDYADATALHARWSAGDLETTITYDDSDSALGLTFDHADPAGSTAATLTLPAAADWTRFGIQALAIYFHGLVTNDIAGVTLFLEVEDSLGHSARYDYDNSSRLQQEDFTPWPQWNVDLGAAATAGVDLTDVLKLTVGIEGQGSGSVYVDNIQLYPSRAIGRADDGDFNGDGAADMEDVAILTADWLAQGPVQVSPAVPAVAPVLYYPFDETLSTVADDPAHVGDPCYQGVISDGQPNHWVATGHTGQPGDGALLFDGTFGVDVPISVFEGMGTQATVSLWVYGDQDILLFTNYAFGGLNAARNTHILSGVIPASDGRVVFFGGQGNVCTWVWDIRTADFREQWNHYAFVKDAEAGITQVYHNGQLMAQESGTGDFSDLSYFRIGASPTNALPYHGMIDEVRIYDVPLTAAEVLYLAEQAGPVDVDLSSRADTNGDQHIDLLDFAPVSRDWMVDPLLWP